MMNSKKGIILAIVVAISMVMVATMPTLAKGQVGESAILEDDFESGNLNKWDIKSGDWEITTEGANHVAHLNRSSEWYRRMVSKTTIPENVIIEAKVKGDADGGDVADTAIGFYSDSNGSSFYLLCLGSGYTGRHLAINKRVDLGGGGLLAENTSVVTSNNIWYNVEIKLEESNISAKIWADGSSEPSDWQVSYSGATPFGNYLLIGGIAGQENEEFWFDNISVTPTTETIISVSTDKTSYNLNDIVHVTLEINRSEEEAKEMILELELEEPCDEPDMLYKSKPFLMPAVFQRNVTFPIRIDKSMWISGGEYSFIATLRDTSTNAVIDRDTTKFEITDEMTWKESWINKLKKFLP